MGEILFSHIRVSKVDKWKKLLKYYSLNVRKPLEINTSP